MLDAELDGLEAGEKLSGATAFQLHDTFGFPLEVTEEIAAERDVAVEHRRVRDPYGRTARSGSG